MLAAGSLAALMKEWPLNSVTLSTATHSKLKETLDETDTQVATCIINRWTAKMKGAEGYITREISRRRGMGVRKTPESSSRESIRGEEEELILERSPRIYFYPSSTPLMIPLLNNPARPLTKSSQRPSSWARFSTKFIVLGLLGLGSGLLTSTVKDPSNQDPTNMTSNLIKFRKK